MGEKVPFYLRDPDMGDYPSIILVRLAPKNVLVHGSRSDFRRRRVQESKIGHYGSIFCSISSHFCFDFKYDLSRVCRELLSLKTTQFKNGQRIEWTFLEGNANSHQAREEMLNTIHN